MGVLFIKRNPEEIKRNLELQKQKQKQVKLNKRKSLIRKILQILLEEDKELYNFVISKQKEYTKQRQIEIDKSNKKLLELFEAFGESITLEEIKNGIHNN